MNTFWCFNRRFILQFFSPVNRTFRNWLFLFFQSRTTLPTEFLPYIVRCSTIRTDQRLLLFFLFSEKTKQPFLIRDYYRFWRIPELFRVAPHIQLLFCSQRVNGRVRNHEIKLDSHFCIGFMSCWYWLVVPYLVFILFYIFFIEILFDRSYITIRIPDHISFIQIKCYILAMPFNKCTAYDLISRCNFHFHLPLPFFSSARSISIYLRRYCVVPFNI